MQNQDFTTSFTVDQPAEKVFEAISHVRKWWSENIEGATDKLNSVFVYHYQDAHRAKMKITEITANQKIVWHVVENYFKFTKDKKEWTGTDVIFEIIEKEGKTTLTFTHKGLVPGYECFDLCKDAWTHYIQGSLKDLITTGRGAPTPKETASSEEASSNEADQPQNTIAIYHRLRIDVPMETVFSAITTEQGLAGWWTPDTTAQTEPGSILKFGFGSDYYKEMRLEELHHYDKVRWVCVKGHQEWIGTVISFELEAHVKGCVLSFHHDNWKAYTHEYAGCNYGWAVFLRSLKLLCETGQGRPYPQFDKD